MNCAEYEAALTRLMADDPPEGERRRVLESLRVHAGECHECAGSASLLDLLGRPAGDRDLAPDPGDEYWSGFEARLASRLAADLPARRSSPRRWWAAAAAAIVLLLVAGWLFRKPGEPDVASSETEVSAPGRSELARAELPPELVLSVNRASLDELEDELAAFDAWGGGQQRSGAAGAGLGQAGWDADLFPDVEQLDAETQEKLLEWLRGQNMSLEGA